MANLKPKNQKVEEKENERTDLRVAESAPKQTAPMNSREVDNDIDEEKEAADEELELRSDPVIEKRIADYKAAYPKSVAYFSRLVKEHPERAINFHFFSKEKIHQKLTTRAMRQMPQMQAIYERMSPESKMRIDAKVEQGPAYTYTRRYVNAVGRELKRLAINNAYEQMRRPMAHSAVNESNEAGTPRMSPGG